MYPVGFKVKYCKNNAAQKPRERICPEDNVNYRNIMNNYGNICHTYNTPAYKHDNHGNSRTPGSPENTRKAV